MRDPSWKLTWTCAQFDEALLEELVERIDRRLFAQFRNTKPTEVKEREELHARVGALRDLILELRSLANQHREQQEE